MPKNLGIKIFRRGDILKFFRQEKGLSIRELSKQMGVSSVCLSNIEKNKVEVCLEQFETILWFLNGYRGNGR